jgi:ATP-dependent protease ClpP protease subunit
MTGHIFIYGEVGKQVTLDTVLKEITPKTSDYVVHVHSNGGDVFEGYAIYNALKNTGKEITVQIEGVCASIATLIASAGTKIVMNTKSQFMIHNPRISSMSGESKDLRNVAGQLDKIKNQLISSWVGRTSLSQEQLSQMYDNETWLTPEQALQYGFVDEVSEVLKAVASADIKKFKFMQDKKSLIGRIEHLINNFFSPKNVMATLADGTVVQLPEGDPIGGQISYEDGSPVPPGEYPLSSGQVIVVGENSTISEVREMPMEDKTEEPENDMKLKEENESLKSRVAELESALQARNEAAEKAEAKARTFENKLNVDLKAVQDELAKIKNTTVGDDTPPAKATKTVIAAGAPVYDPMGEEILKILKSSNRI